MSDLISRSALIEVLEEYRFGAISNDAERDYVKETVLNFVKEVPTAYDVDAVVAELENNSLTKCNWDECVNLEEAIDIVKRGGVE